MRNLVPAGKDIPPTFTLDKATRRQETMEPEKRKHSSMALGISCGSSANSAQAVGCSSSSRIALAVALAVVSWAATMPAIIMECK